MCILMDVADYFKMATIMHYFISLSMKFIFLAVIKPWQPWNVETMVGRIFSAVL